MISVIICTYNRSRSLKTALDSLQKMHGAGDLAWELVVVDNNCRDDTEQVVVDYQRHGDEAFRERQADVWNGFEADELEQNARAAGLREVRVTRLPASLLEHTSDGHVGWLALSGVRPAGAAPSL